MTGLSRTTKKGLVSENPVLDHQTVGGKLQCKYCLSQVMCRFDGRLIIQSPAPCQCEGSEGYHSKNKNSCSTNSNFFEPLDLEEGVLAWKRVHHLEK